MGRTAEATEIIVINLKAKKIYKESKDKYREYGNQILNGWKRGNLQNPKCYFKKLTDV
jgi:hypothetical protein